MGLRLSPGIFEGGVKRLPTLTFAGDGCVVLIVENGRYFCGNCGGGNSKFGRFEAADLRAVKLAGAPIGSKFEAIPGCCTAAEAILKAPREWPGGLKTSVSAEGGVGRVFDGGTVIG